MVRAATFPRFPYILSHIQSPLHPTSPQPKITKWYPIHTNCIITLIWADGVMRTPPVLFTFDKCFCTDSLTTPRRIAAHERFQKCLAELNLSPSQVVVLNGNKMYVRENPDLLVIFSPGMKLPQNPLFSRIMAAPFSATSNQSSLKYVKPVRRHIQQLFTSSSPE